jgi:glucan 1,3-beta-glucosidase
MDFAFSLYINSQTAFGVTVAGEFSNAWNDCGLYVNGIGDTHLFAGDCNFWSDATQWDAASIAGVKAFALASMDALQDWFFWTWKVRRGLYDSNVSCSYS